MKILNLKLYNFKLFHEGKIIPQHINLIEGNNLDDLKQSSNGSGKSTIKDAIILALYGEGNGVNLQDLIHFGTKETQIELEIQKGNEIIKIIRKIPTHLQIFLNNNEVMANTNTIKQEFINEHFGTYDFFKKYRMIDLQGINLLDLGIVSLRKSLMEFIGDDFTPIRKSLLNKKLERETYNTDKRLYKFHLSEKRLNILEQGLEKLAGYSILANSDCMEQYKIINNLKAEMQSKEKVIYYKRNEFKKAKEGICPILKEKCEKITNALTDKDNQHNKSLSHDMEQLSHEIEQLKSELKIEEDCMNHYKSVYDSIQNDVHNTTNYSMKLKEAFKFKAYKYTPKDVMLYSEAIKVLDNFAGFYINDWLAQLSLIINDLLKEVNLSVTITQTKDFLKIKNGDNELKYSQLSSGQKCFLSAIFKLSILLHKGETSGIIIADEGLNAMDEVNFKKFIQICKTLPFQFFVIYQDSPDIEDTNRIKVIRENNISTIIATEGDN